MPTVGVFTAAPPAPVTEVPASFAYRPKFPPAELLFAVRDWLPELPNWDGHEGPRARITYAPGAVGITRRNLARVEKTGERVVGRHMKAIDMDVAIHDQTGQWPERPAPRQEITSWSRKSRANMVKALCEIDYHTDTAGQRWMRPGRTPAMLTLTYPGDWYSVAPTGDVPKRHLRILLRRFRRAWGEPLRGPWKLEFQRRGAPHFHILMIPPAGRSRGGRRPGLAFRQWISETWADVVDHQDTTQAERHRRAGTNIDFAEGLRATDPKRAAVYFLKHGSFKAKEYQNSVPLEYQGPGRGPGRFWGYWGLRRAVHAVELLAEDAVWAARTIRRWARAQGTTRSVPVKRTAGGELQSARWDVIGLAGAQLLAEDRKTRIRMSRRRVQRLKSGAGWVAVNDGAAFATQLARWLELRYAHKRADFLAAHVLAREHRPPP